MLGEIRKRWTCEKGVHPGIVQERDNELCIRRSRRSDYDVRVRCGELKKRFVGGGVYLEWPEVFLFGRHGELEFEDEGQRNTTADLLNKKLVFGSMN